MIKILDFGFRLTLFAAASLLFLCCSKKEKNLGENVNLEPQHSVIILEDSDLSFLSWKDSLLLDCRDEKSFSRLRLDCSEGGFKLLANI